MKTKHNYKYILVGIFWIFGSMIASAQSQEQYSYEHFVAKNDILKYRMLLPTKFDTANTYPLVVVLHGAGERGSDNEKQLAHGSALFLRTRDSFPAIVIFPQCPTDDYWSNVQVDRTTKPLSLDFPVDQPPTPALNLIIQLVDDFRNRPFVETERIYVGGLSMGGMGTFELLSRKPDYFAAAFAICGAGNPETTADFARTVPMWVFHGAQDDVVSPQESMKMVSGILHHGGKPNFSLYAEDNHNSWDSAFAEPELLPWLFSNFKTKQ